MCGIFGYIGKKNNAPSIVLEGLKTLEYRGYDSWGIAVSNSQSKASTPGRLVSGSDRPLAEKFSSTVQRTGKIIIKKRAGKIGDASISELPQSNFSFGHTRWATHGGVTDINAHPHLDCTGELAIIHNGIIENYDELKKEVISEGHNLISETDTEVAIHLIEKYYQKFLSQNSNNAIIDSVRTAFNRFLGLNAIIVMDIKSNTFVSAKSGSPLAIGMGLGENLLASDAHAILPYTKKIYFMDDGEIVSLSKKSISVYETKTGKLKKVKFINIDWEFKLENKGKYPHFMLKEIFEQPKVISHIISDNTKKIKQYSELIKESKGTYLIGCGTAAYAALAGNYIFSAIAKRHVNWAQASEFGYTVNFLTDKSFVIALSQSGETIDVIDAVKKAQNKGAKIGALVNVLGSSLQRLSVYNILLEAGTEKAVVTTKAFTAKLAHLILIAHSLNESLDIGKKELEKAVISIEDVLSELNLLKIKKLADLIYKYNDIFVIGRGPSYPIALETALKIKEASYIHAEGFAAGELKHGVIALIEKDTPCIVFLPNDETYGATLAGAMEIKARGGFIIGVSYKAHEIFDYFLPVKDCGLSTLIPSVVVGQLLGYYLAVKLGFDPDKPRNLAKSVTVK